MYSSRSKIGCTIFKHEGGQNTETNAGRNEPKVTCHAETTVAFHGSEILLDGRSSQTKLLQSNVAPRAKCHIDVRP